MKARTLKLYDSTLGKKAVMAISGLALIGFVFGHMADNLLIFKGPEAMNDYAKTLRELLGGAGIWIARVGLLAAVAAHVWSAIALSGRNKAARPVQYKRLAKKRSTVASRTMLFGGITMLLYIVYHIAHLTFGQTVPGEFDQNNVYMNVVRSFSVPWIVVVYLTAQVFLALHLYHGAWSFMQTLGLSHPRFNHLRKRAAAGLAAVVCVGFSAVPIAVITKVVT
ncbi:MAG: succinate dehydrogenase cytochrome b subunit [Myxococcota bacterium]|nr:succinate dehydrogenase cytochrome b subunit [Myxococcota bacterium]